MKIFLQNLSFLEVFNESIYSINRGRLETMLEFFLILFFGFNQAAEW